MFCKAEFEFSCYKRLTNSRFLQSSLPTRFGSVFSVYFPAAVLKTTWSVLKTTRILDPKNQARIIDKITQRYLSYIKPSCIIFCAKMFGYSQIIYCLQEESTILGSKILTESTRHMSQNVSIRPDHILPTRIKGIFTLSQLYQ